MNNFSIKNVLKKNTMIIVMFVVYIFFVIMTNGVIFTESQFTALITQNAYVFVLGAGMLMCMLTGGNIDLSVGSFVCLVGAIAGVVSVIHMVLSSDISSHTCTYLRGSLPSQATSHSVVPARRSSLRYQLPVPSPTSRLTSSLSSPEECSSHPQASSISRASSSVSSALLS